MTVATELTDGGRAESLEGIRKVAVILISMGRETAARVLKYFTEAEVEAIAYEIASIDSVPAGIQDVVLEEFASIATAQRYVSQGGIEYAREILEQAMGRQRALDVVGRLSSSLQTRPFKVMRKMDPEQILNFLQGEHPQTIALILSYLQPQQAAAVLSSLSEDQQSDVARRLAMMDRTSPVIVERVEALLEKKFSSLMGQDHSKTGGIDSLVSILNQVDRGTEKSILGQLESSDEELAEDIRKRLFTFDDIAGIDDRSLQRVLREVDLHNDMPLALKASSDQVKEKIFANISDRGAETVQEDMEYLGPVRLSSVEEAQQRIVNVVRQLDEKGEIVIARGSEESLVV
ncbi:MAG: flagellar motor switch protein FliG [Bacillota bacterium]